jgi:NAD(P)-dependent dehydrogenase (short-subunit alcohol dehydrogenase family)
MQLKNKVAVITGGSSGIGLATAKRFKVHDTTTAPAPSAEILKGVQKAWGFVPNLHRVLAESPAALEAYATLWGIAEKTRFTPIAAVREGRPIADAKLEALRRFAALVTRNRGVVSHAEVEAFKAAGYDNQAILDVLVLSATKLISNYANHLAQTPLDAFMKGSEWQAPGKLEVA